MNLKNRDGQRNKLSKAIARIRFGYFRFVSEQTITTSNSIFNHNKNVNKCNPVSSTASTNDDLSVSFECSTGVFTYLEALEDIKGN